MPIKPEHLETPSRSPGLIMFERTPLGEVLDTIERYGSFDRELSKLFNVSDFAAENIAFLMTARVFERSSNFWHPQRIGISYRYCVLLFGRKIKSTTMWTTLLKWFV